MKEYYRTYDSPLTIPYTASTGTIAVEYTLTDINTNEVFSTGIVNDIIGDVWNIILTKEEAAYDRVAKLSLEVETISGDKEENYIIKICRQYATAQEISSALGLTLVLEEEEPSQISQSKVERLEKYARAYIDTNIDRFYFEKKYISSYGQGSDAINFTERVYGISKIWEDEKLVYDPSTSLNDFELLLSISPSSYQIKMIEPGEETNEWYQKRIFPNPVAFKKNVDYKFYGEFGWLSIPNDINYATILLINEYLCSDFNYKARGVSSASNDSFSVKYMDSAMSASGNAYIDSILSPYKKLDFMAV